MYPTPTPQSNSAHPGAQGGAPPAYDNPPLAVLGIFGAYIIVWFLQLGDRIALANTIRIEFLLGATLIVLALAVPRQKPETGSGLYGWTVALLIAIAVQVPLSMNVQYSWTIFIDRVVKFACMAVFISVFVRSPRAVRIFLAALLLAWFKMGQEGFTGQLTGSMVWENQGVMRLHGVTGNYSHPNSFSGFGLGMLPFIYYFFPLVNKYMKGVLLIMLAFAINIILFTGSRTGYVGFILFAAFVFLRSKYKLKFMIAGALIGIVALPFIPPQYVQRFQSITGEEKEGHSKLRRLEIAQDAIVIFQEHPFGIGVSAFSSVRMARFGRNQDTHNLYLEVLTNLGIQGFIVWLLFILALFRNARRLSRDLEQQIQTVTSYMCTAPQPVDEKSPVARHLLDLKYFRALISATMAYLVVRLAVGFFGMDLYEIYWWFSLGIIIAVHNMAQVAARITKQYAIPQTQAAGARSGVATTGVAPVRGAV